MNPNYHSNRTHVCHKHVTDGIYLGCGLRDTVKDVCASVQFVPRRIADCES